MKSVYWTGLLAIFFWSTSATAFKLTLRSVGFFQLLLQATLLSLLFYFFVLLFSKRLFNPFSREYRRAAISGLLNPAVYYLVLFYAYQISPAQYVIALNYSWPVILTLLVGLFLKEKITFKEAFFLFISFSGVVLIFLTGTIDSQSVNLLALLLALLSSFFWALYWIVNLKTRQDALNKLFASFSYALLYLLLLLPLFRKSLHWSWAGFAGSLYIALFEMGLTFLLWLYGLQKTSRKGLLANLVFISPFLSLLWVNLLLKEKILKTTFVGLMLIILGIVLQKIQQNKKIREEL